MAKFPSLSGVLAFEEDPGGLWFAKVRNAHATATLSLQGAQLLHWQPHTQAVPVLWLSDSARRVPGSNIRGGIPVCWPWFGAAAAAPHAAAGAPAHGFVRTLPWEVAGAETLPGGQTQLRLCLRESASTLALWPSAFSLELQVTVGGTLELALTTRNTGAAPMAITEALHTYFRVGAIGAVAVHGLAPAPYFDAVAGAECSGGAPGPVTFEGEVDRVYASAADCRIDDPVLGRSIHIAKWGSASTVVWNPAQAKATRLGDMEPVAGPGSAGGWQQMVCVESGNARAQAVLLAPGQSHVLGVRYGVERLGA